VDGTTTEEDYILRLLDECREEIRVSDSKASLIFTAVTFAAAVLSSLLIDSDKTLRTSGTAVTTLSVVAIAAFVWAMVLLGMTVIPRVGRSERGHARYFEEQAQFDNYHDMLAVVSAEASTAMERHAQQLFIMSRIAQRKFMHLRHAMIAILVGVAVMTLAVLIGAIN